MPCRRPVQRPSVDARVVTGADRVEAERERAIQHRGELDPLVATDARVGGAAGGVLRDEVVNDVRAEPLGHVPDVERDAQHVGGPARVAGVLQRAAAASPVADVTPADGDSARCTRGDVVPCVDGTSRGNRGVHATATVQQNAHRRPRC